jgi:outer membrane biosynthesis protein TonB
MKKNACVAALFLASMTASSLADDSDKQMKTDGQAKEAGEKAEKKAKEASEKAEKKAKEASEKAEKKAKEASEKAEKKAKEPWDIAFGAALMSDFNFRGVSASDHRPAVSVYFEPHYDFSRSLQAYAHVEAISIEFPTFEAPAMELYGGVRPTFDRLALDFGVWEHWLPAGRCFNFRAPGGLCIPGLTVPFVNSLPPDISYWEVYGRATYYVDRQLSFGSQVYWTPTVFNTGADGTYVRGWARYVLPPILPKDFGWFISAEAGHWFRDTSPYPSYSNWKAGLAFTWKQFTLDLRYSSTDRHDCIVPVASLSHTSNICGTSFIAALSFDLTKANVMAEEEQAKEEAKADKEMAEKLFKTDKEKAEKLAKADKDAKTDKQAKEAREKAEKEAKEAREKIEKEAKEAREKAEKQTRTPWDIAFGAALMSDYNFRGISASDHRPAASAYFESRYDFSRNLQAYAHVETDSVRLPNTPPTVVEIYGGVRSAFDRLVLDLGIWEHWFPARECFNFQALGGRCIPQLTVPFVNSVPRDISFQEVYGKATYYADRQLSFGGGVYWTPSLLNSGAEATYVAGWANYILPPILPKDFGWFISAEAGHWFRDTSPFPSYTNWNAGLAFTWKQFTLDLRYSDTDRHDCAVAVAAFDHTSNRCGASFIARLAVDLTKHELTSSPAIPIRGY